MMKPAYKDIFARNLGLFSEAEQEHIRLSSVAIAGVGGVGGLLAERLVRLGVGSIKILDPECFDVPNLNRQYGCHLSNLGRSKADEVAERLRDINPEASISHHTGRISTQADADRFVEGCGIIADEMDFGLLRESVYLQRAARRSGAHYLFASAIGFGALVAVFGPGGCTLEEYNGLPADRDLGDGEQPVLSVEKVCPYIPAYILAHKEFLQEVVEGKCPPPVNAIGAGLAALLAANEILNLILERRPAILAPDYVHVDLMDGVFIAQRTK